MSTEQKLYRNEINKIIDEIKLCSKGNSISFAVCTDTHYGYHGDNGYACSGYDSVIEGMFQNIKYLNQKYPLQGLINLGDCYEGNHPKADTLKILESIQKQMHEIDANVYTLLGNHDDNTEYEHLTGNEGAFSQEELFSHIQNGKSSNVNMDPNTNYYYVDFDSVKLRCIFLNSIYHNFIDIGFSDQQMEWLRNCALKTTPEGYDWLIFSHCPIRKSLNWNHENIHNDMALEKVLLDAQSDKSHRVLAYIHGHVHVDSVNYNDTLGFPMIGLGCAKFENITETDKKVGFPPNSVKENRVLNTPSEQLWDVLTYNQTEHKLFFTRFGAGKNRVISV